MDENLNNGNDTVNFERIGKMEETVQASTPEAPPVTYDAVPVDAPREEKASGLAMTALICGILSFCCCGIFAGIPAIVIGWLENNKIKEGRSSDKGKWMALTGLILGFVSILWTCLWIGWYFFYGGMAVISSMRPY